MQFHNNGANAQGGCAPTGHFLVEGNYFSASAQYICANAVDSHVGSNTAIAASPGPNDLRLAPLQAAGPDTSGRAFADATNLESDYVSAPQATYSNGTTTMRVQIGGAGFAPGTPVFFSGHASPKVDVLSPGFLIAALPPGAVLAGFRGRPRRRRPPSPRQRRGRTESRARSPSRAPGSPATPSR